MPLSMRGHPADHVGNQLPTLRENAAEPVGKTLNINKRARAQERRVGADARQLEERGPDSADASLSGIEEFSRLGEKIDRRRFDILRTIRSGLSNARLEAVNNKIKTTIKIGYGYRNLGNLIALVMLKCGGLNLQLPGRQ